MNESKIILAADGLPARQVIRLVTAIGKHLYAVKIHDLYDFVGPVAVQMLKDTCPDLRVWIDFKLIDIPATIERRAKALARNGADILTVSAEAGGDGMKAAVESGAIIYAATVLTSEHPAATYSRTGKTVNEAVLQRAIQAAAVGVHGIVCSAHEMRMLAAHPFVGRKLERIALAIRQEGDDADDQVRVATPAEAMAAGAHRIVMGRPLIRAEDPVAKIRRVEEEIGLVSV